MSGVSSPKFVKVGGSMVAKPVNIRVANSWKPVQNVRAYFYVTPSVSNYANGATVTITLRLNSGANAINSMQANMSYDSSKLQYVSSNVSSSNLDTNLQNTGGSGALSIALAKLGGSVTGDQLVSTLTFTAIATGSSSLSFTSGTGIAQASDSTNICDEKLGGMYTIT